MSKIIGLGEAPAPTNVEAFSIAGGALADSTTYYYKLVAYGYQDIYWDNACWLSVPSAEVSVTTDATNKTIIVHGDVVTGTDSRLARAYCLYRTETSGDYNITDSVGVARANMARPAGFRSAVWNTVRINNVTTYDRHEMTTSAIAGLVPNEILTGATSGATAVVLTDPAGGTTFKVWTITGTFTASEDLDGSVSGLGVGTFTSLSAKEGVVLTDSTLAGSRYPYYELGAPVITVAGGTEADPVRMQDIQDYLIGAGKTYCLQGIPLFPTGQYVNTSGNDICNIWNLKANLVSNDITGYFKLGGGEVLNQCGLKHIFKNNTIFGEESSGLPTRGCAIVGTWHYAFYNGFAYATGTNQVYGSMLGMNYTPITGQATVGNVGTNPWYQADGEWTVKDSVILSSGRLTNTCKIYNSRMMVAGEIAGSDNSVNWETENAQFNTPISQPTNSGDSTRKNFIVNRTASPDIRIRPWGGTGNTYTHHFVSPTFSEAEPLVQALTGNSATAYDAVCFFKRRFNIKVLDEDSNYLEDVEICVQDKDDKDCIFEEDGSAFSTDNLGRTGTTVTTTGVLKVGSHYHVGDEIILVEANPSGTTYTIARGQLGTDAHALFARPFYFYEMLPCVYTDSLGNQDITIISDKYKELNLNPTGLSNPTYTLTRVPQSPFTITFKKDGFETLIIKANVNEDMNGKYTLKKAIPVMIGDDGKEMVRLDPTNSTVNRDVVLE